MKKMLWSNNRAMDGSNTADTRVLSNVSNTHALASNISYFGQLKTNFDVHVTPHLGSEMDLENMVNRPHYVFYHPPDTGHSVTESQFALG